MVDFTGSGLRIAEYGLRITDYGLRIADYGLRITDCGLRIVYSLFLWKKATRIPCSYL